MKIYALNTLGIGQDTIDLISRQIEISGVIGLSNRKADDSISDYTYQSNYCRKKNIDFIEVDTYTLSSDEDKEKILNTEIDVLIIIGWQRLIPKWFIEHCSICAMGIHGSPVGITKGRGRSPQNWAILLGLKTFSLSLFEIDAGIDSGRIIDSKSFSYSDYDDIKTSYYKTSLASADLIVNALRSPDFSKREFREQDHEQAEYFPQRLPQDGAIDWHCTSNKICNFVRALTKPYPGAYTSYDNNKIHIWSAKPFDIDISLNSTPGEIVKIFNKSDILVASGNGYVLIEEFEIIGDLQLSEGMKFKSVSFDQQMNSIISRHNERHADLPLSPKITRHSIDDH